MAIFLCCRSLARRDFIVIAIVVTCWIIGSNAHAQTWMGPAGTGDYWSNAANWVGGATPSNDGAANVVFSQSNSSNVAYLDTNWNVASVYFNTTPGLGLGQGGNPVIGLPSNSSTIPALTVQGGGINSASTSPITINPCLVLARSQTWNVGTGGLIVSIVSGPGNLTKTGPGKLTLASTQSTFTGNLNITAGTVLAKDGAGGLGADNATVSLGNGATVALGIPANVSSPPNIPFNHTLTLGAGGGTINCFGGYATFSAPIIGAGSLTLGLDTQFNPYAGCVYNFANPCTYSGGTIIGSGVTVTVTGNQQALGTGDVTVGGGGLLALASMSNLAGSSRVILQDGANTLPASALVLNDASLDPAGLVSSASTGGVVALGNLNWTTALDLSKIGSGKQSLGAGAFTIVYAATTLYPGSDGNYRLGGGAVR